MSEEEATQSEMFDAKDEVGTSPKLVLQSLCVLMNQTLSIMCIKFHTYLCVCDELGIIFKYYNY
jgi:hypothetical protein